jgi:hypothetical protein
MFERIALGRMRVDDDDLWLQFLDETREIRRALCAADHLVPRAFEASRRIALRSLSSSTTRIRIAAV